ncbi:MAG TPA: hypothetical protein VM095_15230, partial [Pyrinomonadaceae bacterium]|nr:hypothetical protein [Pyrinomonadaceae bacterium]
MNCQMCRFEIEELETDARLSQAAREHLSSCPACRAFHDGRQSLKKLVGSLAPVEAPPDFDFRLRARINAAKSNGNHQQGAWWRSFVTSAPAIGLAATFALLVAAVLFYNQTKRGPVQTAKPNMAANQSSGKIPEQASVKPPPTVKAPEVTPPPSEQGMKAGNNPAVAVNVKSPRSRAGNNSKNVARRESNQPAGNAPQIVTTDTAVRPAPQIMPKGATPFNAGA